MKTETRKGKWLISALLFWLAFAPLAQAFYNPSTGRWLSRDPIEERGGINLGAFTRNNPISKFDLLGMACGGGSACAQSPDQLSCSTQVSPNSAGSLATPNTSAASGYQGLPSWFYNAAEEGKPCCCEPKGKLRDFKRTDPAFLSSRYNIAMEAFVFLSGCYRDFAIVWWTCWRPDGSGGLMSQCDNSMSCNLNVAGVTIPGIGDISTGPHITTAHIRYLSCENGKWVKHIQKRGRTYIWENGDWTWQ